ncbi:DUF1707 SHOCT-like domain-containing protein [Modestobacter versicolor]|uniref:DUF1707 domain-containing protein n=1 Tax=Modestobacter versicolor TaxID=429133 RepID=A0A323V7G8_9ACTN|nr:DUF1707 domain-containing protein [Modestobacter versicolor]MBB3677326.1 hypothetical protein [Modestobacter versicolor]PZA20511.1 DUF1707 domain-containing protein [Modestobacter versicolor]
MPESHLRASDADRAAVADVLGGHMSAGRLTVAEYDERLARAYAARTYGELAELTADLPAPAPTAPAQETAPAPAPGACGGQDWSRYWAHGWSGGWTGGWAGSTGLRAAWASWLTTAVIVVGIWALSSAASGDLLYPWPVWVIGPWGVVLLAQSLGAGPGRDRQPALHGGAPHRDR